MPALLRLLRAIPLPRGPLKASESSAPPLYFFLGLPTLAAAVVSLWGLGAAALTDTEAFYAEIAREMLRRGDWLTPQFDFARFFDKPPLYYWLELLSYSVLGVHEFAARLPAALAFTGTVFLTAAAGALIFDGLTGLLAGSLLVCSMGFFEYGHTALVEPLLCFWMTATLVAFLAWRAKTGRASLHRVYLAMALAALTKGLTGIVFPSAVIAAFLLLSGELPLLPRLFSTSGIALFLLVFAPWHLWSAIHHPGYLWFHFVHEQFLRFSGNMLITYHPQPTWMFLGSMAAMIFPWSLYLPQALLSVWDMRRDRPFPRPQAALFPFIWAGVILAFFCLSRFKLDYYSIPAWPPVLLLIGRYFAIEIASPRRAPGTWVPAALISAFGAVTLIALPGLCRVYAAFIPDPWLIRGAHWTATILLLGGACAAAAFYALRPGLGLACLCLMMPPIFAFAQRGTVRLEPQLSSAAVGRAAGACLDRLGRGRLVHAETLEDVYVGSAAFYSRRKVWLLKPKAEQSFPFPHRPDEVFYLAPEELAAWWKGPDPVLFIDETAGDAGRPWKNAPSRFHLLWSNQRHRLIANRPVCGAL